MAENAPAFLAQALDLGRRLTAEAVWFGDRCSWMGAEPVELGGGRDRGPLTHRALGIDLYAGTSGLALFLAELHAATGDADARTVALGAMRHAFSRVASIPPPARLGLFTGWPGVALAGARVGLLLDDEASQEQARRLLGRLSLEERDEWEFDVVSGRAGAAVALLTLARMIDDPGLLNLAERLGDELLGLAVRGAAGYSWKAPQLRAARNLTGLSHGTAGVAWALLELFSATGHAAYRDAAQQAFAYERHWFSAASGNWPDFRQRVGRGRSRVRGSATSFATFWCHGAPGIALSRLRAAEILRKGDYVAEAAVAIATTHSSVQTALEAGTANFSLCHGLLGNSETLLRGRQVAVPGQEDPAALVNRVACAGIERHRTAGSPWPCGTHTAETPNLMLGLAGIGHFYLRLAVPTTPSVLLLDPVAFASPKHAEATDAVHGTRPSITAGTSNPQRAQPA